MLTWKLFTHGLIILDNPTSFLKKNKKIQKKIWIITVLFSRRAKTAQLKNLGDQKFNLAFGFFYGIMKNETYFIALM
jgi:hypothetical protein